MPKNPQYESMVKVRVGRWTVRIWRTEVSLKASFDASNEDVRVLAGNIADRSQPDHIAQVFTSVLKRIAAIEVLDECGNGGLLYPDWK